MLGDEGDVDVGDGVGNGEGEGRGRGEGEGEGRGEGDGVGVGEGDGNGSGTEYSCLGSGKSVPGTSAKWRSASSNTAQKPGSSNGPTAT